MNILAELLPGARNLRAPLAIGYLWLLAAWLNFQRFPVYIKNNPLQHRIIVDAHGLTPVLIVIIISFFAYLLGLLLQIVDDIIVQVCAGLVTCGVMLYAGILLLAAWRVTLPASTLVAIVLAWRAYHHKELVPPSFIQRAVSVYLFFLVFTDGYKEAARRVLFPLRQVKNRIASDKLAELLDMYPEKREQFCQEIDPIRLRLACHYAMIRSGGIMIPLPDGTSMSASRADASVRRSSEIEKAVRTWLLGRLKSSREISGRVALKVMRTDELHVRIDVALTGAEAWLRAEKPAVFESCDRLRSEGEFRCGVTIPAMAVACSLAAAYVSDFSFFLLPAIAIAPLYASGLKKYEEAAGILAGCINAGITPVTFDVTDERLLSWVSKSLRDDNHGRPSESRPELTLQMSPDVEDRVARESVSN